MASSVLRFPRCGGEGGFVANLAAGAPAQAHRHAGNNSTPDLFRVTQGEPGLDVWDARPADAVHPHLICAWTSGVRIWPGKTVLE
jgi:hypothetical protein